MTVAFEHLHHCETCGHVVGPKHTCKVDPVVLELARKIAAGQAFADEDAVRVARAYLDLAGNQP